MDVASGHDQKMAASAEMKSALGEAICSERSIRECSAMYSAVYSWQFISGMLSAALLMKSRCM